MADNNLKNGLTVDRNYPVDTLYGPYSSIAEANAKVTPYLRSVSNVTGLLVGRTICIDNGIERKEYWWDGGTADSNLVEKVTGGGSGITSFNGRTTSAIIPEVGDYDEFYPTKPTSFIDGDIVYVDADGNLKSTGIQSSRVPLLTDGVLYLDANGINVGNGQFNIDQNRITSSLNVTATANNQTLYAYDFNAVMANDGFTGFSAMPFRLSYNSVSIAEFTSNTTLELGLRNLNMNPPAVGSMQFQMNVAATGGAGGTSTIRMSSSSSTGNIRHYHITGGNTASYVNFGISTGIVFDVNPSSVVPTALVHIGASVAGRASMRLLEGITVTTPNNGEFWVTTSGVFIRSAGVTLQLSQNVGANQAAITDSTTGTAGFTLVDVGAVFSQANINNNIASLNRQLAAIRTALITTGLIKGSA